MKEMNENCGVFAAYDLESDRTVIPHVIDGLFQLQHRGQLSTGITSFSEARKQILRTLKGTGLVSEVFHLSEEENSHVIQKDLKGAVAIGHVRYATSGHGCIDDAQPFEYKHGKRHQWFSFAFNGNLANAENLAAKLTSEGYHLRHDVDTEVIMHFLARSFETDNYEATFTTLQDQIDGACSMVTLNALGNLFVYRDKHGFKPICYTITPDGFCLISSESSALLPYSSEVIDVAPGELITILRETRTLVKKQLCPPEKASCFLEYVYFSRPTSRLDGCSVYDSRLAAGRILAEVEDQNLDENCVVIPVPDSARIAAEGFAETLGIPLRNGLIRNTYAGRTFIEEEGRVAKVRRKFSFAHNIMHNKRIFLLEDSLVRSTTLTTVIQEIHRQCGPR
ncbi:MAG: class II glutamine amidotransferase [Candidatus Gracilibacteria bacterium]